jgi:SAM-dependent methyltransferase
MPDDEVGRIEAEYRRRDAAAAGTGYADPAYHAYMQELEWALLDALRAAGVELAGARVLDVGTGSGHLLHRLVEFGAGSAVGFDLMPDRIAAARDLYPTLELVQGNAAELPFADGEFGLVTQFTCLSSILDPEVRTQVAREMWRVTRPGGAILSYDLRPAPAPIRRLGSGLRRLRAGRGGAPLWTPVEPLGPAEVRALFPAPPAVERSVSLNVALPAALRRRRGLALALAALPPLRSHLLAVVPRDGGAQAAARASTSASSSAA